jgi:D-cysteine desulfhydrase
MADRARPMIFDRWPALAERVPWLPLVRAPTPVEPCDAIEGYTGHRARGVDLWMKRDDLSAISYGGNKVRRYEFLFAHARALGADTLVTVGGLASTQATATAVLGPTHGFKVALALYDQPVTDFALDALRTDAQCGASMVRAGNFVTAMARAGAECLRGARKSRYFIAPGASSARANLGYVDAMLELGAQVDRGECPRPDAIVAPAGSGGTVAGLALGARVLGWDTLVIGVRIAPWIATNRVTVGARIRATAALLTRRAGVARDDLRGARWTIEHGFIGPGYGYGCPEAREGAAAWQDLTGATGEVTYSGKQLWALRDIVARPRWKGRSILLWNTLSTPRPRLDPDATARVPDAFAPLFLKGFSR